MEEQPLSSQQADYFLEIVKYAFDKFGFLQIYILFFEEEHIMLDYLVRGNTCQLRNYIAFFLLEAQLWGIDHFHLFIFIYFLLQTQILLVLRTNVTFIPLWIRLKHFSLYHFGLRFSFIFASSFLFYFGPELSVGGDCNGSSVCIFFE